MAASLQWDANGAAGGSGGSGTWNTSALTWFNGTTYQAWNNAVFDDAVFGGTAGTVTLGGAITVHNLSFATSGYTVTGSTLTLGGADADGRRLARHGHHRLGPGRDRRPHEGRRRHADAHRHQHLYGRHDDCGRHAADR